jgi:hypothetical protein
MDIQHTYRIRHKGVESTPHSLADLRQMWRTGKIDSTTEFRRGDSSVWLDANDLWVELHLDDTAPRAKALSDVISLQPNSTRPGATREIAPTAPIPVRLVSARLPFREVFVLVFKFYAAAIILALLVAAGWLFLGRYLP